LIPITTYPKGVEINITNEIFWAFGVNNLKEFEEVLVFHFAVSCN
jgi:hypothetical protein